MALDQSDVFQEYELDEFDFDSHWKEAIDNTSPSSETFSTEAGEAVVAVRLGWEKARSFIRKVLGFQHADSDDPWMLHRENPIEHPRFPWLVASTVSLASLAPIPNYDHDDPTDLTPNVPGIYDFDSTVRAAQYSQILATVRFRDIPWLLREDSDIETPADEFTRNVWFSTEPNVEILSAEGGNLLKFSSGHSPPNNLGVPASIGTLKTVTSFNMHWMRVPHDYISSDPDLLFPDRFIGGDNYTGCVGTVNSTNVGPFIQGTLLMMPPKFERFPDPIATMDGTRKFFSWNITVPFQHFDPANRGDNDAIRGHNLMPYRPTLKWYEAFREDGVSRYLPESDHNDIFRHVLDY